MITIIGDPAQIAARITAKVADILEDKMTAVYNDLTAPPPTGTPVDEGTARNGWELDVSVPLQPEVVNRVPYIGRLNDGHSQQSPSGFVDAIVDKHLR